MASLEITTPDTSCADKLVELWLELAEGQQQYGSHVHAEPNRSQIREALLRHTAGNRVLVARRDALCGFVMFTIEHGEFEQDITRGVVENLYVAPDSRTEGIGSELLAAAETELSDRGADVISLDVMADNTAARRFYRKQGYETHRIEMEK